MGTFPVAALRVFGAVAWEHCRWQHRQRWQPLLGHGFQKFCVFVLQLVFFAKSKENTRKAKAKPALLHRLFALLSMSGETTVGGIIDQPQQPLIA
eukprot:TRINITY_DN77734_c0_g1_i2.p1 TRINITY_DN77734_c0_g1~~TRINITY_DN77734_c0_g1_i2.p1  ORF type:complete len:107 (+),score=8.62 TRINITY_DN77734_c0_g1_i2:39-323(+)